jgi:predicted RNase H-like HicB family nuclease
MEMKKILVYISWNKNYSAGSEIVPGCMATHETLEGVKEAYRSALEFHLEGMHLNQDEIPDVLNYEFELVFELNTQALLHHFEGLLTRSALSRITGINQRQLGHYATGHRHPRPEQRTKIIEGIHRIGKEFCSIE